MQKQHLKRVLQSSRSLVKEFMFCLIDTSGVILTIDLLLSGDELVEEKQLALKCLEEQS